MEPLFAASGADALAGPVKSALRAFQLSRREHLKIYAALASDQLGDSPFWADYKTGAELRNRWVHANPHGASPVSRADAEAFVLAVVALVGHLETVMHKAGVKLPSERFVVENLDEPLSLTQRVTFLDDGQTVSIKIIAGSDDDQTP